MEIKKIETNEKKEFEEVKFGNKKIRFIVIIIIFLVCVIAVGIGVYFSSTEKDYNDAVNKKVVIETAQESIESLKNDFNDIFKNDITGRTDNIEKKNNEKDIVYTSAEKVEVIPNKYDLDVQIPQINIDNAEIEKINSDIRSVFQNKASNILAVTDGYTIYKVKYHTYINGNILSLIIKANLKEGRNSERAIVKTYNYDIENKKELEFEDLLSRKNLSKDKVQKQIEEEINEKKNFEKSLSDLGYNTYSRDLENEIYKIDNTSNYILGTNGMLYIIYAYGNNYYTSEIDLIII